MENKSVEERATDSFQAKYVELVGFIGSLTPSMAENYMRHDYRSMWDTWQMVTQKIQMSGQSFDPQTGETIAARQDQGVVGTQGREVASEYALGKYPEKWERVTLYTGETEMYDVNEPYREGAYQCYLENFQGVSTLEGDKEAFIDNVVQLLMIIAEGADTCYFDQKYRDEYNNAANMLRAHWPVSEGEGMNYSIQEMRSAMDRFQNWQHYPEYSYQPSMTAIINYLNKAKSTQP